MPKSLKFTPDTNPDLAHREVIALKDLHRLMLIFTRLEELYPLAHDAIQRQTPTPTGDTTGIRGSDISDPTLAAVTARWHATNKRDGWVTTILTLLHDAQQLEQSMGSVTRYADADKLAAEAKHARCAGRPDCVRLAVVRGLCSACYQDQRRHPETYLDRWKARTVHVDPTDLRAGLGTAAGLDNLRARTIRVQEAS